MAVGVMGCRFGPEFHVVLGLAHTTAAEESMVGWSQWAEGAMSTSSDSQVDEDGASYTGASYTWASYTGASYSDDITEDEDEGPGSLHSEASTRGSMPSLTDSERS